MLINAINGCLVFMVLVMFGCFAAGAADIADERAKRKRIEKWVEEKYGKTH